MRSPTIRTPAWHLCVVSYETEESCKGREYHVGLNGPTAIDFICSQEPYAPILAQSSLVESGFLYGGAVEPMSLIDLLRGSEATAEGM